MSFVGFDGKGYQSFVADSSDLVHWTPRGLAMGFGATGEFDHGGCVIGAYLYESYDLKAPRLLKKRRDKYWTLYGAYPCQDGYELRPGYEGVAWGEDGLTWKRAKTAYIISVHDGGCRPWERDCIYQPWLVEHDDRYYNFYNAANGGIEQMGLATSNDLLNWERYPGNPVLRNRPGGYDERLCSDGKVFRDDDHWVMFYFGVGRTDTAHIMVAFSRDLIHWTSRADPLYLAGGNPSGLDKKYAHKVSIVYNPKNDTLCMFYDAVPGKKGTTGGRGIGLITSRPLETGRTSTYPLSQNAGRVSPVHLERAKLVRGENKYEEAAKEAELALTLDGCGPSNIRAAHVLLAMAYTVLGNKQAAEEHRRLAK